MAKNEFGKYRAALEAKLAEVERELGLALRDRENVSVQKAPDDVDLAQLTAERELAITNLDRLTSLKRQIKAALARIEDGTYGVCLECDEPISPNRLNAVPWTALCVRCQEAADARRTGEPEPLDLLLEQDHL